MFANFRRTATLLLAAALSLISLPALAQSSTSTITGSVVDQRNALPVAGATVSLIRAGSTIHVVHTGGDGRFRFKDVVLGIYDVTISASGYTPSSSNSVAVASGTTINLDSALYLSQTSASTGFRTIGRVSSSANKALTAVTTISQDVSPEELLRTGQIRVTDQLESIPGMNVNTSSSPGDDSSVNIRGFGSSETSTLLDGHPVGPLGVQVRDRFNYSMVPTFGLSNVNVTYGSGAQGLYGNDTVAGAVNFETISPTVTPERSFLQSFGGYGKNATGISAAGTFKKLGYAVGAAVQGTTGAFNGQQIFQSARPSNTNSASLSPNGACNNANGNDVSLCNQNVSTYAVSQSTKLTSEIAKLKYNFTPSTAFQVGFYSGTVLADSTGNGDNDNLPYASRLAQINAQATNCTQSGGSAGYTVVTNPIANTTACYSAQQWAATSSGPDGGGAGRDRSTSMRDYDFRFTTQAGINNVTVDAFINNYFFFKNSVQSGGFIGSGSPIGTPDFTDYFNTHGYLISDDLPTGKNDLGFGYSLINQLQTSNGLAGVGPIDPITGLNFLAVIPNYNFPASYFSEGSFFVRDNYMFSDKFSIFANVWGKRSSVTQKTTFDPRITALVRPTQNDVIRLTYGRSDGAPAPLLKQLGVVQVPDPGASLTSVSCIPGSNGTAKAGNPNLTSENANDFELGYGHRFRGDSNIQVNAYVTNLKNQLIAANEPVTQFGLGNLNFLPGALNTYISRLNANGCLNGGVNPSNVYQFLGVSTTYNLGNQLARGLEISGRERINHLAYIDYGYYTESSQYFNIPDAVLANNATELNGSQVAGVPLHQATLSFDIAPGPWDFRIDNYYTEFNNQFNRPSYWHSDAFLTRAFNHGKTLLTLGGTNIFNQATDAYGYIGQGTFTPYNSVYATSNGVSASNALQEFVNGISSNERFGLSPAQLTLTLTERV